MPELDTRTAVLLTVLGGVVVLVGLVFLLLGELVAGAVLVAIGTVGGSAGYRSTSG